MEIELNAEQVAQLSRIAARSGRNAEDLAREAVDRYLAEENRFQAAVAAGQEAAARGDFVPTADVWTGVEQELQD